MNKTEQALLRLDEWAADNIPEFPTITRSEIEACLELASGAGVAWLLNRELARAVDDPELFDANWMGSEVSVFSGTAVSVAISHLDTEPRLPFTLSSDMIVLPAHASAEVAVECFELPASTDISVFDSSAQPTVIWRENLTSGKPLLLRAGQGVRFMVRTNSALLTVRSRTVVQYSWYFDPVSLSPLSIHSSSVNSAIAHTLSDFLGSYGDASSVASLESLLEHPVHTVRFAAAKDVLRLSLDSGREAFSRLARDPHPHLRQCAVQTVSRLPSK